jgi:hypothetical protein
VTDMRGHAHSYTLITQYSLVKPTALSGTPYPAAGVQGKAVIFDTARALQRDRETGWDY